ncbi:unnamed protein product, partial [Rangifer tarandus platyrhynchus]
MTIQEFVSRGKERAGQNGPVYPSRDGGVGSGGYYWVSGRQSRDLGPKRFCRELEPAHTHSHTHTPTPLCSRLEFLQSGSLALLLAALHASAGPLVKELCPSGSSSREWETPGDWPRAGLRMRPSSAAASERAAWSLLRALPRRPLCVTKFGKNMDLSQSFHVCSQLPAEKAKGSLPVWLLREPLNPEQRKRKQGFREKSCLPSKQTGSHTDIVYYTRRQSFAFSCTGSFPVWFKLKLNVAAINTRLPPGFHPTRRREFKPREDQECPSPSLLECPRWSSSSHIKEESQGSGCEN